MTVSNEVLLEGVLALAERMEAVRESVPQVWWNTTARWEQTAPALAKLREVPLPPEAHGACICGSYPGANPRCPIHYLPKEAALDPVALERMSAHWYQEAERWGKYSLMGEVFVKCADELETYLREAGQRGKG